MLRGFEFGLAARHIFVKAVNKVNILSRIGALVNCCPGVRSDFYKNVFGRPRNRTQKNGVRSGIAVKRRNLRKNRAGSVYPPIRLRVVENWNSIFDLPLRHVSGRTCFSRLSPFKYNSFVSFLSKLYFYNGRSNFKSISFVCKSYGRCLRYLKSWRVAINSSIQIHSTIQW